MPVVRLITHINAPIEIVFDLARSIDLHKISTAHTNEEAIAGKTFGLISLNESVTWRAKHFGISQTLTSIITVYNRPFAFTDEMVQGAFKAFKHDHLFAYENGITAMTDVFEYKSPFFLLGSIANALFLKRYMKKLLAKRNAIVKEFAEDPDKYQKILPQ